MLWVLIRSASQKFIYPKYSDMVIPYRMPAKF